MTGRPELKAGETFADESFALSVLPRRSLGAHKWGVGGLMIVAGGPTYIGAAALCAMAAGRSGAGIVTVAIPRGAIGVIAGLVPESVFLPLSESDLGAGTSKGREDLAERFARASAAVIGPGLGDDEYADGLLGVLFGRAKTKRAGNIGFQRVAETVTTNDSNAMVGGDKPAVIDADGLNWLAKQDEWWKRCNPKSLVLTPHIGEFCRLSGLESDEVLADPMGVAKRFAKKWNQIVLLKHGFSVATDGERSLVAPSAPLSFATAGAGDVLAGSVGAFLAQGVAPLDAAGLAMHLGCGAAATVELKYGVLGLIASDLPVAIAGEIARLEQMRG